MIQTYSKLISNSSEILPSQLVSICLEKSTCTPEVPVPPSSLSHPSRPKCCLQVKGRLATFGKSGEPALCHTRAPPTSIYSLQLRDFHDLHEFNLQRMCISCSCVCQCGTSQRFLQLSDLGRAYEAVRVLCKAVVRDVRQFFQVRLLASG